MTSRYRLAFDLKFAIEKRTPYISNIEINESYTSGLRVVVRPGLCVNISDGGFFVCFMDKCTVFKHDEVEQVVEQVVDIIRSYCLVDVESLFTNMNSIIRNQVEHLDMLKSLFAYSDSGDTNTILDVNMADKFKYVLHLQDQCKDLLSSFIEYQPDSEEVSALGEEFDKLKMTGKME